MSFVQFESGTEKERIREELRCARDELLKRAEHDFKLREQDKIDRKLRGEDSWMLPAVSKKIDSISTSSHKKSKKEKREKKKKRKEKKNKKKRHTPSDSEESRSSAEDIIKSKKKRDSDSDSSRDQWVEKVLPASSEPLVRNDWMSGMLIATYSKDDRPKEKEEITKLDSYDPGKSSRELNPHWKNGGTGMPTFMKPKNDSDDDENDGHRKRQSYRSFSNRKGPGNWRKKAHNEDGKEKGFYPRNRSRDRSRTPDRPRRTRSRSQERKRHKERKYKSRNDRSLTPRKSPDNEDKILPEKSVDKLAEERSSFLTDQQMNELAAKIIKAEIMGNDELAGSLKGKLEKARECRNSYKIAEHARLAKDQSNEMNEKQEVLLTTTDSRGVSRPVKQRTANKKEIDPWGGRKARKTKKVETHSASERIRYFADDDKYDLKQMFEKEKFTSANDQDEEFVRIAGKHSNPNDDLEDLFAEKIQRGKSDQQLDDMETNRAIQQHRNMVRTLESCDKCFDSEKMEKQLIVSMGTNVYLSLPWHEGLQPGHCLIVPIQHVSCSTNLDENVWNEIIEYQKALCQMFRSRSQDVIFFETVRNLHKRPHMIIHCVPNKNFELAPFYFKKAIQEAEREWSTNKQLISLKEKNLRRSVPKGLPYFWVHFGIDNGFAHIIEEQDRFPGNFAQETIGGLLNLDPRLWRRPRREPNPIPKVKQFADWWKPFDINN